MDIIWNIGIPSFHSDILDCLYFTISTKYINLLLILSLPNEFLYFIIL